MKREVQRIFHILIKLEKMIRKIPGTTIAMIDTIHVWAHVRQNIGNYLFSE